MREIKFRVWNKATKTMHYPGWDELAARARLVEMELMQFIGLKDKNGKEIYEGDIVQYTDDEQCAYIGSVEYSIAEWTTAGFVLSNKVKLVGAYMERYEVIGNIYENPNK